MQKRGISEVVVWIIGLALVLVLIVVVWSVVRVFVGQRVENIESTSFVNMKIIGKDSYVQLSSDELPYLNIKVKREAGSGEVGGIRFVLSDGVNTSSFVSKEEIKELQEKNFKVPVGGLRSVEKVEIAPVFISESGKESTGVAVDEYILNKDNKLNSVKNAEGLIAWYRFEGDVKDSSGNGNDGILTDFPAISEGKAGRAYDFDGVDDGVKISNSLISGTYFTEDYSVLLNFRMDGWENRGITGCPGSPCESQALFQKRGSTSAQMIVGISPIDLPNLQDSEDRIGFMINTNEWVQSQTKINYGENSEWYHVGAVYKSSDNSAHLYVNGEEESSNTFAVIPGAPTTDIFIASGSTGGWKYFDGKIDEVMIFNRTLNEEEVRILSNLEY